MLKKALLVVVAILVLAQAYRPEKTNPPVDPARSYQAHLQVSPEVARVFERSCKDCHSNATAWPWYSHVAPVSWVVISDVHEARKHLNLSEWGGYTAKKAGKQLEEICEMLEEGEMPLWSYTMVHSGTAVSESERNLVCQWTKTQAQLLAEKTGSDSPTQSGNDKHEH